MVIEQSFYSICAFFFYFNIQRSLWNGQRMLANYTFPKQMLKLSGGERPLWKITDYIRLKIIKDYRLYWIKDNRYYPKYILGNY